MTAEILDFKKQEPEKSDTEKAWDKFAEGWNKVMPFKLGKYENRT